MAITYFPLLEGLNVLVAFFIAVCDRAKKGGGLVLAHSFRLHHDREAMWQEFAGYIVSTVRKRMK